MKVHARRILAATVSMAVAASFAVASGTASAAEQPHAAAGTQLTKIGQVGSADSAVVPQELTVKAGSGKEKCVSVAPGSKQGRAGAVKECVRVTPQAPTTSAKSGTESSASTLAAAQADAETCSIGQSGFWTYERFGSCLKDMVVNFTLYGDKDEVLGTATLNVNQSMTLSATSSTWNELVTVTMTSGSPAVTSLNVAFDADCDSACTMSNVYPWTGARALTVGSSVQGTVTYTESLAYDAIDYLTTQYHMYVTQSGTIPTQPNVNWSNPRKVRCDNAVYQQGSGSPGCVYADIQPNLEYSIAQYGAAAVTYSWALNNLPNMANTFRRLKGDSQPNRDKTCGYLSSVPFIPFDDSIVQDDSCDEFPFAGTYEGGTDGGLCAEIVPLYEDGVWNIYQADDSRPVTGDEPCVRSHVPSSVNSAAGGKYGSFVQTQRLIDTEKFTVSVTA